MTHLLTVTAARNAIIKWRIRHKTFFNADNIRGTLADLEGLNYCEDISTVDNTAVRGLWADLVPS